MITDQQYLEHAQAIWDKVGDCPLANWQIKHQGLTYIRAEGKPPRCKKSYNHVFLFLNEWNNGRKVRYLRAIARREFFKPITWSSMNGEVFKGKVYHYFDYTETELTQSLSLPPDIAHLAKAPGRTAVKIEHKTSANGRYPIAISFLMHGEWHPSNSAHTIEEARQWATREIEAGTFEGPIIEL